MASGKRIIRNTTYLSLAYVGQKFLSFVYFTLIARWAGVFDTGAYVFALAYSTIFTVFVDFGLSQLVQREIAQNPEDTERITQRSLGIKFFYAIFSTIFGLVLIHFLTSDPLILRMVYIAMAVMLVDSFNLSIWAAFRGVHRLVYESIAVVLSQAIVLTVGITGLVLNAPLEVLIVALLCGSIFTAIFSTTFLRLKLGFWPKFRIRKKDPPGLGRKAVSFGLAGVFTRIFASFDTVLLRQIVGEAAVGFYAIPNKVVFAAQFIPAAFAASIYPAMSHHYQKDDKKMLGIFEQSFLFLLILSIPMTIGLFVLTPIIVEQIFSAEYLPSILAMQILVWGIIFGFTEFPIGALLAAIGQQNKNTITRGVVMVINVVLNFILIPLYSFVGTSIAALASYVVLVVMGLYWVRKYVSPNWRLLGVALCKIILAALAMGAVVWALLTVLHWTLVILVGIIVYTFLAIVMRIVKFDEIRFLLKSFRKGA